MNRQYDEIKLLSLLLDVSASKLLKDRIIREITPDLLMNDDVKELFKVATAIHNNEQNVGTILELYGVFDPVLYGKYLLYKGIKLQGKKDLERILTSIKTYNSDGEARPC